MAASLANTSAVSFRGISQCPGIHCSRIDVPCVLIIPASFPIPKKWSANGELIDVTYIEVPYAFAFVGLKA